MSREEGEEGKGGKGRKAGEGKKKERGTRGEKREGGKEEGEKEKRERKRESERSWWKESKKKIKALRRLQTIALTLSTPRFSCEVTISVAVTHLKKRLSINFARVQSCGKWMKTLALFT